ncbi:hypothetical protein Lal_00011360 [Lupinus albus]|nr:hypothetical protein Lal_00011360 [Lupinus albus]
MFGGMLFGYVMYDCTHYYMHHSQPKTAISKNLKVNALLLLSIVVAVAIAFTVVTTVITVIVIRIAAVAKYHLNHHNRLCNYGFGVTSPVWDFVFGTFPPPSKADSKSR